MEQDLWGKYDRAVVAEREHWEGHRCGTGCDARIKLMSASDQAWFDAWKSEQV